MVMDSSMRTSIMNSLLGKTVDIVSSVPELEIH